MQEAVRINPDLADAHSNLARALTADGRISEAIAAGMKAASLNPQLPEAYLNMGTAFLECGAIRDALACYRRSDARPDDLSSCSNYLMALQYSAECSSQDLYESALSWGRTMPPPHPWKFKPRGANQKLRIGYVSGDLGDHPVGHVMEPILRDHDRSRVEVFCYSNSPNEDEASERMRRSVDRWRVIRGLSDHEAAQLIHTDGVHILVDLSGHTAHHRLGVFALKPAPIQASWLAYFATTGLSQIDYLIRDPLQVPPSEHSLYVEKVWPLKNASFGFDGSDAPELTPLPALINGYVTFGSFNNLSKVSHATLQAWAAILRSVPGSVLRLDRKPFADPVIQKTFTDAFGSLGIGPDRLRFGACRGRSEYYKLYEQVDVVLDTFPFNGGTTTFEALWMGVPVVSHRWERMVGHFAESILKPLGHLDWVADTQDEMVRIATGLVTDLSALASLRADLREQMRNSTHCRPARCAQCLEDAYFGMWAASEIAQAA